MPSVSQRRPTAACSLSVSTRSTLPETGAGRSTQHAPCPPPSCRNFTDYRSADGEFVCGTWDSTPYHRRAMFYRHYELMYLLEGSVTGDPAKTLRINEFSIDSESYTGASWRYQLEAQGTNIGDMTAINDHEFIVIERNGATATNGGTPFKKLFRIDIRQTDAAGNVLKTEIVDLMNIADPNDLNGDGSTTFTFPYVTIEDVLVLDSNTLLVINDNNYPGTGGRDLISFFRMSGPASMPEKPTMPASGRPR